MFVGGLYFQIMSKKIDILDINSKALVAFGVIMIALFLAILAYFKI